MKDTRILEKRADALIQRNDKLVLRFLLKNGRMVERIIKPVQAHPNAPILYRDIRKFYMPKKGKIEDVATVNTSSLRKIESVEMPCKTGDGNTVKDLLVSLLDMGYIVAGGE